VPKEQKQQLDLLTGGQDDDVRDDGA
jgi:hypothetical protein